MPPFANRIVKRSSKLITFDGVNFGAIGATPVFSITGSVWIESFLVRCPATLVGVSATIALGCVGNTGGLIAATTAANITTGLIWTGTSPAIGIVAGLVNFFCDLGISATVATAAVTAGQLQFEAYWLPMGSGGQLY